MYHNGTQNIIVMLVVSSREFRKKQAEYMDKLDSGEQIIIQRGKNKAYSITPIKDEDIYFAPQMIKKIKDSILQATEGKTTKINNSEELKASLIIFNVHFRIYITSN